MSGIFLAMCVNSGLLICDRPLPLPFSSLTWSTNTNRLNWTSTRLNTIAGVFRHRNPLVIFHLLSLDVIMPHSVSFIIWLIIRKYVINREYSIKEHSKGQSWSLPHGLLSSCLVALSAVGQHFLVGTLWKDEMMGAEHRQWQIINANLSCRGSRAACHHCPEMTNDYHVVIVLSLQLLPILRQLETHGRRNKCTGRKEMTLFANMFFYQPGYWRMTVNCTGWKNNFF